MREAVAINLYIQTNKILKRLGSCAWQKKVRRKLRRRKR
jgi:hypothetical protein